MAKLESYIWFEKYRPKELSELVLEAKHRQLFEKYLEDRDIPHLLFVGGPGTGKTTISEILIHHLDPENKATLRLNASSDRGINVVREKIYPFITSKSSNKLKLVFLDEFDATTRDFQTSLRNYMEQYSKTSRFILTCNYMNRIIEPLLSRCTIFQFKELPRKAIFKFSLDILEKENVNYDPNDVKAIIKEFYPDVRTIINTLQASVVDGELEYDQSQSKLNLYKQIVGFIKFGKYSELGVFVNKNKIDFVDFYKSIFNNVIEYFGEDKDYVAIRAMAWSALKDHTIVPDPFVNFLYYSTEFMKLCGVKEKDIA